MKAIRVDMQHMSGVEALSLVAPETIARIKTTDAHPEFRVYAVAHEGEASGRQPGKGYMALQYFREAIRKIYDRLALGTPLFAGHAQTNDYDGRQQVGEVVAKAMREYGGKLYDLAVAYVLPEHAKRPFDVCSIETEVLLTHGSDGRASVIDVGEVTGIALGASGVDVPGFPGATLLAAVQAFARENETMTVKELKEAAAALGVKPSELFDADALKADTVVQEHVKSEKQTEYEHAKRVENKLAKEREGWEKREAEITKQLSDVQAEAIQGKAKGVLDGLVGERKLSDKQRAFIEKRFSAFNTEAKDADALKADLNKFLDAGVTEFTETAKFFGVDVNAGDERSSGSGPADHRGGPGADLTKPENNDLIAT